MLENSKEFYVTEMAAIFLEGKTSGYYSWVARQRNSKSKRMKEEEMLMKNIKEIFDESGGNYGSPKISAILKSRGILCNRHRAKKIMNKLGLEVKTRKKFKVTTNSKHNNQVSCNLLGQEFTTDMPNKVWTSDITYVWTEEGWLYLAVIMDLYSRKIIGWAIEPYLKTELVLQALKMALKDRILEPGIMFHSDKGVQYTSKAFRKEMIKNNFIISMSGKGNCYDNAVTESFFSQMKKEAVYSVARFSNREWAKSKLFYYINAIYNRKRPHSTLGYKTPEEFENAYWNLRYKKCA